MSAWNAGGWGAPVLHCSSHAHGHQHHFPACDHALTIIEQQEVHQHDVHQPNIEQQDVEQQGHWPTRMLTNKTFTNKTLSNKDVDQQGCWPTRHSPTKTLSNKTFTNKTFTNNCSTSCCSTSLLLNVLLVNMPQSLTRVSISRNSREEMTHVFLSRAGELYFHFSFSSRISRFLDNKSLSFLDLQDFLNQFSFSSRFSRLWRQKSLSTLDSWDSVLCFSFSSCEKCFIFLEKNVHFQGLRFGGKFVM